MTINLGIDLGTTNSAIACAREGRIQVFTNPRDMGRRTLPSVVAFRKERTIIGSKARERMEKDAANVFGVFKRKMGTSERFTVPATGREESPVTLSAHVLRELLTFLPEDIAREAAVITIPASFDTVQSKATEAAGMAAGFRQVSLLQEPIAASLAFANQAEGAVPEEGKWLVYDLGGGTFDVALLSISEGEMKVVDHAGDNFLGGTDFDRLIVERFLVPRLEADYSFTNLWEEMRNATGRYNAQFYILRQRAEEAKIQLSSLEEVDIIVDGFTDDRGQEVDLEVTFTQADFNDLIGPKIAGTVKLIQALLQRNALTVADLEFVLLVGGSTYIPLVREQLSTELGLPLNTDVDPTTCVAEGAAAYAATRPLRIKDTDLAPAAAPASENATADSATALPALKLAYPRASREEEETLVGKATGNLDGWQFRILREDGGFDSGLRTLKSRFFEDLPLVTGAFNNFTLILSGPEGQNHQHPEPIGINGGFAISGQPLPEDITLEIDDPNKSGGSRCLLVFEKNAVLPLRRTLNRALNRNLRKGVADDQIRINVLEGPAEASPEANKKIGFLSIDGTQLSRDVSSGTDVEISLRINENRDLTVMAYLTMTGQEFEETFTPTERHTPVSLLQLEYDNLARRWAEDKEIASENEEYELLSTMLFLEDDFLQLGQRIRALGADDATDERYQLEDLRRHIVRQLDAATIDRLFQEHLGKYEKAKRRTIDIVEEDGDENDRKQLTHLRRQESDVLANQVLSKLKGLTRDMDDLYNQVFQKSPRNLRRYFGTLATLRGLYQDENAAERHLLEGQTAIQREDWNGLKSAIRHLNGLLPAHLFSGKDEGGRSSIGEFGKIGF